jgi:hypothetical protein
MGEIVTSLISDPKPSRPAPNYLSRRSHYLQDHIVAPRSGFKKLTSILWML